MRPLEKGGSPPTSLHDSLVVLGAGIVGGKASTSRKDSLMGGGMGGVSGNEKKPTNES